MTATALRSRLALDRRTLVVACVVILGAIVSAFAHTFAWTSCGAAAAGC